MTDLKFAYRNISLMLFVPLVAPLGAIVSYIVFGEKIGRLGIAAMATVAAAVMLPTIVDRQNTSALSSDAKSSPLQNSGGPLNPKGTVNGP